MFTDNNIPIDSKSCLREVVKILTQKNPRTKEQVDFLAEYCKHLSFFEEFVMKYMDDMNTEDDKAITQLFTEIKFEEIPPDTLIFQEDETSNNKMYVILDGEVQIFKKAAEGEIFNMDMERFQNKELYKSNTMFKKMKMEKNLIKHSKFLFLLGFAGYLQTILQKTQDKNQANIGTKMVKSLEVNKIIPEKLITQTSKQIYDDFTFAKNTSISEQILKTEPYSINVIEDRNINDLKEQSFNDATK